MVQRQALTGLTQRRRADIVAQISRGVSERGFRFLGLDRFQLTTNILHYYVGIQKKRWTCCKEDDVHIHCFEVSLCVHLPVSPFSPRTNHV